MATNIFPGVYTTIVDESFTMQPLPGTIGFICLFSEKGPDNVPRMTTSVQDLINTYGVGNPAKYGQGWYIAKQYLSILGNLYVLRALPDDAAFANLGLKYDNVTQLVKSASFEDVASVAAISTHIETEEARRVYSCREHFIATSGQKIFNLSNIRTSNNIMLNVYRNGLYMLEGIDYTINITSKKLTFTSACNQDDVVAIYQLYYGAINILKVDTENFISINNQITFDINDICNNNTFNIFVYRNGLYQRKNYDYIFDSNTNTIIFNNSLPGDDIIKVLCFSKLESNYGYANINIKNVFAISGQTVFDFSDICESNAIVYRNGLFQTYGLDYIINDNYIQFVNPCNADDLITIITFVALNRVPSSFLDASVIFYPVGRGSWYNNIAVKLTPSSEYAGLFDCYNIDIYQKTVEDEYVIAESFLISFDKDAVDYTNESLFVEHVLDRYSQLLRAKVADNIDLTQDWSAPFTTYLNLQKGDDGTLFNATTGFLDWTKGTPLLVKGYTGALTNPFNGNLNDEITDPECLLFSVVFDAGYPSEVKDAIVDLCDIRTDCFAFLDNGDNPSPTAAITARTTDHNYNNYRAALFEMYTKVYDAYTGKYYWFSPIYHFAKAFAKTDRDYDLWWPTAGLTRGVVDGIKDIRYKLVGGYKDQFKLNQLNPIMRWSNGGDCIWGNWTTQKRPSALQNIHVVLTLLYIKRVLEWNLKYYIFDLNDEYTWELIKGNVSAFLGELRSKRALEWFKVKVFADDYDKKLNRCQVQINLQITGAIEVISITLTVQ